MLKIGKKSSEYVKNGKPVFSYTLVGTEEEIAAYVAQSQANSEETKKLFYTSRPVEPGTELILTTKGTYAVSQGNLEEIAIKRQEAVDAASAKFEALEKYSGLSKTEIVRLMMTA